MTDRGRPLEEVFDQLDPESQAAIRRERARHDINQTLERLPHNRASCPGDSEVACIDGRIYVPCGEENCYGSDVAGPDCDCVCHAIEEILPDEERLRLLEYIESLQETIGEREADAFVYRRKSESLQSLAGQRGRDLVEAVRIMDEQPDCLVCGGRRCVCEAFTKCKDPADAIRERNPELFK